MSTNFKSKAAILAIVAGTPTMTATATQPLSQPTLNTVAKLPLFDAKDLKTAKAKTDHSSQALKSSLAEISSNQSSVYPISLALIASAIIDSKSQDKTAFLSLYHKIMPLIDFNSADVFNAWMLGRVLLATHLCGYNGKDVDKLKPALIKMLQKIPSTQSKNSDPTELNKSMYAWAYAYLGSVNSVEYFKHKPDMLFIIEDLEKKYKNFDINFPTAIISKKQELLSNFIWVQVMYLQAAANAKDKSAYDMIISKLKSTTSQTSLGNLTEFLGRTEDSSDYPAWALGFISYSAYLMKDKPLYNSLKQPLESSIETANKWGETQQKPENKWKAKAEVLLTQLLLDETRKNLGN